MHYDDDNYKLLTPQQQVFVDRFVQDRDVVASVQEAYPKILSNNDRRREGLKLLSHVRIAKLLATYYPLPRAMLTIEELRRRYLDIADAADATTREKLQALIAYERVSGYSRPDKPKETAFNPLDDIQD